MCSRQSMDIHGTSIRTWMWLYVLACCSYASFTLHYRPCRLPAAPCPRAVTSQASQPGVGPCTAAGVAGGVTHQNIDETSISIQIHFRYKLYEELETSWDSKKDTGKSFMCASPNQSIIGAALVTSWQSTPDSRALWRLAETGWTQLVLQHWNQSLISQSHTNFLLFRPLKESKIY